MRISFCPYTIFLMVIFSIFFLHTVFILNEDHTLMAAYELGDAGNIAYGIMSLFDYPIYSQHNYFFGQCWFFNDINFLLILLLKGIGQLLGFYDQSLFGVVDNQPLFNGTIRAVNFVFALASILLFFKLSNLLFNNKKISLVASLFFMFLPWSAVYSYWLKADATGLFFILLATWYLVKFIKQEQKLIYFYIAFISLILTTFSKMYHGFYLFPIFLLFFLSYCDRKKIGYFKGLFSYPLLKLLITLPIIYLIVVLIVHPYSIIDFGGGVNSARWMFMPWEVFLGMFKSLISGILRAANAAESISFTESFNTWFTFYKTEPIIYLNTLLFYLLIIPLFMRHKFSISSLFVTSVIFCNLYLVIVIYGNRSMHYELRYIYPIAPLLILNIVAFLLFIWKQLNALSLKKRYSLKILFAGLAIAFIMPIFAENILVTTNSLLARAAYQQSTLYQTRQFLLDNFSTFSQRKMLFDLGTAPVPPKMPWVKPHASVTWVPSKVINQKRYRKYLNPNAQIVWVSWESQFQSVDFIKTNKINPQFLILGKWRYNTYRHYIEKHHFRIMKTIKASHSKLASLSYWYPHSDNMQLKSFNTTLQLIELHRNPDLIIGPTVVFYHNRRN
jgi:hypothetical protein